MRARVVGWVVAVWVAGPALAQAQDPVGDVTLPELCERLAEVPGLYAEFREEKYMALLEDPLVDEGTLHFAPPRRMARHTLRPRASTVLIDRQQMRFGDASRQEALDLQSNPTLRMFVDGFLLLWEGDLERLRELFEVSFSSEGARWHLTLRPRRAPLSDVIAALSFEGEGVVLSRMVLEEVGGDRTVTTYHAVDAAHVYDEAEIARVFRIGGGS